MTVLKRRERLASRPESAPEADTPLIAALREGHREFLRFLAARTASHADAEDVLQDFYLKVVRGAWTVRSSGKLKSWLAQVLRRTLADYYRKAGVRKRLHERLKQADERTVLIEDEAERAVCDCLYRLLPSLAGDYAQILWRVELLGEPRDRVARSLGISPNNLGVRLHRARRALRAALERFCTICTVHGFLACECEGTRRSVRDVSTKTASRTRAARSPRRLSHAQHKA